MPSNRHVQKQTVETYAAVLLDAAIEAGGQDVALEVRDQAERIIRILRSNLDLANSLSDETYTPAQRSTIAKGVFASAHPVLTYVLATMAARGDVDLLRHVWQSYCVQLEQKLNVCVVDVTTTVALDDNLRKVIENKVEADLGTKAVLREHIDKSLIGGILLSVHGMRTDATVRAQLEHARSVLKDTVGGEC